MSSISPINFTNKIEHHKKKKDKNKGFIIAQNTHSLITTAATVACIPITKLAKKTSLISKEESLELLNAANKGLKQTGLADKNAEIFKIHEVPLEKGTIKNSVKNLFNLVKAVIKKDEKSIDKISSDFKNLTEKLLTYTKDDQKALGAINNEFKTAFLKGAKDDGAFETPEIFVKALAFPVKNGSNAFCLSKTNKIIIPDKSLQTTVFHEMGHALNANSGVIIKGLQKCRGLSKQIPQLILLISLLNKTKTTDETDKSDSIFKKGSNFIKRNSGKLAFITSLPIVLEEGIASLRGQKVAKNLVKEGSLSKDLYKKVKISNLAGFSTYLIAALAFGWGVKKAVEVKDKIQEKNENV